jgi:hypothetical protein
MINNLTPQQRQIELDLAKHLRTRIKLCMRDTATRMQEAGFPPSEMAAVAGSVLTQLLTEMIGKFSNMPPEYAGEMVKHAVAAYREEHNKDNQSAADPRPN